MNSLIDYPLLEYVSRHTSKSVNLKNRAVHYLIDSNHQILVKYMQTVDNVI